MKCTKNKSWEQHHDGGLDIYFTKNKKEWIIGVYFNGRCMGEKKCHQWHDEYYFTNFILNVLEFNSDTNVDCEYFD